MKKDTYFYFDKGWFVFPLAFAWRTDIYELVGKYSRLEFHFLWFHWRCNFNRKE